MRVVERAGDEDVDAEASRVLSGGHPARCSAASSFRVRGTPCFWYCLMSLARRSIRLAWSSVTTYITSCRAYLRLPSRQLQKTNGHALEARARPELKIVVRAMKLGALPDDSSVSLAMRMQSWGSDSQRISARKEMFTERVDWACRSSSERSLSMSA